MKERVPHITLLHTVSGAARRPRKAPGLSLPDGVPSTREAVPRGADSPCSGVGVCAHQERRRLLKMPVSPLSSKVTVTTGETTCRPDEYEVPGNPSCSRVCPAGEPGVISREDFLLGRGEVGDPLSRAGGSLRGEPGCLGWGRVCPWQPPAP